ncbi:MAG: alpha/beta hydrolase-fold protein [Clostridiaceae bacterium]
MKVEYHEFYSQSLNRMMPFKSYGHAGKPIVIFPTSEGRFNEYEDSKMIDACKTLIEEGIIRFYALDSIDSESWLNKGKQPNEMARIHNLFDSYVVNEVVPYMREHSGWKGSFMASGCSMGGFHSVNFYFRHPYVFDQVIALSGVYDARLFVGNDISDPDVYMNSPVDYIADQSDPDTLEAWMSGDLLLCTGQGAWEENSIRDLRRLKEVLYLRRIPARIEFWGNEVNHDWPWWRIQMQYFLESLHSQNKLKG